MAQAKLLLTISVIALSVVWGLFIPKGIKVFGQEQLEHSTNRTSISTQLQEPPISTPVTNQSSVWIDSFNLENCNLTSTGANTYFVLEPGYQLVLEGQEDLKPIQLTIKVLNETKLVNGTETRVVEEKIIEDGNLAEISNNYFAMCQPD